MSLMQTWVDPYPCYIERKGGHFQLEATKSIVTANLPPWSMYKKMAPVRRQAFCERFTVYKITKGCRHPKRVACKCKRRKTLNECPDLAVAEHISKALYTGHSQW